MLVQIERQPDQFGGGFIIGEVAPRLQYLAQSGVHTLNGIGSVDDPTYLGWEGKKGNHL